MTIAQRILNYQADHRLSRKEFADKIGYSACTVANWEHGKLPSNFYQYEDLATLFEISVYELMKGERT